MTAGEEELGWAYWGYGAGGLACGGWACWGHEAEGERTGGRDQGLGMLVHGTGISHARDMECGLELLGG